MSTESIGDPSANDENIKLQGDERESADAAARGNGSASSDGRPAECPDKSQQTKKVLANNSGKLSEEGKLESKLSAMHKISIKIPSNKRAGKPPAPEATKEECAGTRSDKPERSRNAEAADCVAGADRQAGNAEGAARQASQVEGEDQPGGADRQAGNAEGADRQASQAEGEDQPGGAEGHEPGGADRQASNAEGADRQASQVEGEDQPGGAEGHDPGGADRQASNAEGSELKEDGPTLSMREEDDRLIGTTVVGRYKVQSCLKRSSSSVIYKARHLLIERDVVLRILLASDIQSVKRFQHEAKIASNLSHPNIVPIIDFGVAQGRPYMVTDYLEGKTLAEILKERGPLPIPLILDIFTQVCDALNYAHKLDIYHRYLKPSNIMLIETEEFYDVVKLLDFGISKRLVVEGKEVNNLLNSGIVYGDPHYMSPESCLAVRLDGRSDIYALGCVMYEALAGVPPFRGETAAEIMHKHITKTPPPVSEAVVREDIPEGLTRIIMKALDKDPDQRYRNVETIWTDIEVLRHGAMQRAPRDTQAEKPRAPHAQQAPHRSHRALSFVAMLIVGIAIGLALTPLKDSLLTQHPSTRSNWQDLNSEGEAAFKKGDYQEAENLFGSALAKAGGFEPDDPRLATTLNNLGNLYFARDLYPEAQNAVKRALAIREKAFGPDSLEVADSLDDLGMIYLIRGRTSEAEPLIKRAYEIRKRQLKPDHEDIAQSLQVMAALYHRQGRLKDAMENLKKALSIRERALGSDHPDVANTYNSLGMQYQLAGQRGAARDCYARAKAIVVKQLGLYHPLVADSLVGLATLDFLEGRYERSERLFKNAMAIRKETLGENSFRVGEVAACLGILDERRGKLVEAEENLRRAVEIDEQALGPNSEELVRSLRNLSRVLKKQGKHTEAQQLERQATAIEQELAHPSSLQDDTKKEARNGVSRRR